MKTRDEIAARLVKLRSRYRRRHMSETQDRKPCNCVHNAVHVPSSKSSRTTSTSAEFASRQSVTLVVLGNENEPIRLCMYGSESPDSWPGNVCDSVSVSRPCKMFTPRVNPAQANSEFNSILSDDASVLKAYPDVAALQWVISERVHSYPVSLFSAIVTWVLSLFMSRRRSLPEPDEDPPEDLWADPPEGRR